MSQTRGGQTRDGQKCGGQTCGGQTRGSQICGLKLVVSIKGHTRVHLMSQMTYTSYVNVR